MVYIKPQVLTLRSALDAIESTQQKDPSAIVLECDCPYLFFEPAYEVDE